MNNNKISELQKENETLKKVIEDNNISNKNQISQILEESNNLKKENESLKNENKKLIDLNKHLNLKIKKISNDSSKEIKNLKQNIDENFLNKECLRTKISNNLSLNNIIKNTENYYRENNNNFDSISLMNKKIENLNKRNEEIFKSIYKNSKSLIIERKKI